MRSKTARCIPGDPKTAIEKIRKAIKSHICCECLDEIAAGEKYSYLSVQFYWANLWQTYKTCLKCKTLRENSINPDTGLHAPLGKLLLKIKEDSHEK